MLNFYKIISIFLLLLLAACQTTTEINNKKPVEIAILLPLTGPEGKSGREYEQLIIFGLNEKLNANIHTTTYDVSTPRQAASALEKLVTKDTKIILGPLYSSLTTLISAKAREQGIVIITLSNNPSLANSELFVFGHAPYKQLQFMVDHYLQKEHKEFITLLPASNYSSNVNNIIKSLVENKWGDLIKIIEYERNINSINEAVAEAYNLVDQMSENEDSELKPVIYISDDSTQLTSLFSAVRNFNLDKKSIIIGDNKINLEIDNNIQLYFSGSNNADVKKLKEKAQQLGISDLSFMHYLAYDLGKVTAAYMDEDFTTANFINKLQNSRFAPLYGTSAHKTYFIDSVAQREYEVINKY